MVLYKYWLGGLEKPQTHAQLAERDIVRQRYGRDLPYYGGALVMISR